MPLPHYTQAKASIQKFETVQPNLFEVTMLPPAGIGFDTGLVLQHVKKISGLDAINPAIEAVGQKYKFADRSYAGMPGQTFVDLDMEFTVNLNDANEAYIYKSMQDWYKLIYDPATGEMGLKKDYVGTIIVLQYNRAGDVFRKITFKDAFPTGNPTFVNDLDYESQDPAAVTMKYRSDYWIEELV
jgi:hypothetical protein